MNIKNIKSIETDPIDFKKPEQAGRLAKLTFTTIKDYGGKDCAGSTSDSTGQSAEMYIGISPDSTKMLNCDTSEGQDCWLLKKVDDAN